VKDKWKYQIDTWDELIKEGRGGQVRLDIVKVNRAEIPRRELHRVANVARRVRLENWGMQLLYPIVRSENKEVFSSAEEICEYSNALMEMGSLEEARNLLLAVNPREAPQTLLYLAFLDFREWNSIGAGAHLRSYLKCPLDLYAQLVGQVNLAAALVQTPEWEEARGLLDHLELRARTEQRHLLLGNIFELRAQLDIQIEDWSAAARNLDQSLKLLENSHHDSLLFTLKWKAVLGLKTSQKKSYDEIKEVQLQARKMKLWETVRDCDRHIAIDSQNAHLLNRLYHGTPFTHFRDLLLREFSRPGKLQEYFDWVGGRKNEPIRKVVDLGDWSGEGDAGQLTPGQLSHALISVLAADLYSPKKMGSLFGALFPNEYFNPVTSPEKVYKVVQRARTWFLEKDLPMVIDQAHGYYRLRLGEGISMRLRASSKSTVRPNKIEHLVFYLQRVKQAGVSFSAKDLAAELQISQRTVNRLLKEACEAEFVEQIGKGRSTLFKLKNKELAA
jgi:hypothetical protein